MPFGASASAFFVEVWPSTLVHACCQAPAWRQARKRAFRHARSPSTEVCDIIRNRCSARGQDFWPLIAAQKLKAFDISGADATSRNASCHRLALAQALTVLLIITSLTPKRRAWAEKKSIKAPSQWPALPHAFMAPLKLQRSLCKESASISSSNANAHCQPPAPQALINELQRIGFRFGALIPPKMSLDAWPTQRSSKGRNQNQSSTDKRQKFAHIHIYHYLSYLTILESLKVNHQRIVAEGAVRSPNPTATVSLCHKHSTQLQKSWRWPRFLC